MATFQKELRRRGAIKKVVLEYLCWVSCMLWGKKMLTQIVTLLMGNGFRNRRVRAWQCADVKDGSVCVCV